MRKKCFPAAALLTLLLTACKKEYTCQCTNPGGTFDVFSTSGTREKAERKCQDYYEDNFGHIPMNETACSIK